MHQSAEVELLGAERVYVGAGSPVHALRPTSLRIAQGELVGVVGRSGSGKSTLLNILGLLDRPSAGRYLVRGVDTALLSESEATALRASQFGFVFQQYHLLADRTTAENVELGLLYRAEPRRRRWEAAERSLRLVGLAHRMHSFPPTLSGGERQRVAVARALAQRPQVLLCDEPTGNLDRSSSDEVIDLLRGLNATGLTVVVVTHDHEIAAAMPRCLQVDDGIVRESVTPEANVSS